MHRDDESGVGIATWVVCLLIAGTGCFFLCALILTIGGLHWQGFILTLSAAAFVSWSAMLLDAGTGSAPDGYSTYRLFVGMWVLNAGVMLLALALGLFMAMGCAPTPKGKKWCSCGRVTRGVKKAASWKTSAENDNDKSYDDD